MRIVTWLAVATALLVLASVVPERVTAVASAVPDNIRLTWSDDPKTTQTIGWSTDASVTIGKVQYTRPGQPSTTVTATAPVTLLTNVGGINLFSATIRDLQPGARYSYRVGDAGNWSEGYTFATEPASAAKFTFLVFGDSHEKKPVYSVWGTTATHAYEQNPAARFVMSVGDLIYAGKDYGQWQAWFAACQRVIAQIPDMPAIGDHEPRGVTSDEQWQRPEYFVKLFTVPQNGPADLKGEVYSFDYGFAHIAVLNSSVTYEFAEPARRQAMLQTQAAWLDADLAATAKPWKIVVYHDSTYNLVPDRSGTLTKLNFGPVIDKHHVDAVFNAHDHGMARSFYIRNEEFVASAAEGTVYYVSGRTGDNAKDSLGPKVWHPFFYDPQEKTGYLAVDVDEHVLTITTKLEDGTTIDRLTINKAHPEESTPVVPFGAYQSVRFAAFGSVLQFGRPPVQNDAGEWFVDIHALAAYMSGAFDPKTNVFAYKEGEIQLQLGNDMFLDASREMVSLTGLRSIGFYCKYHKAMNMVMVERWRD
jgi:hypothetical protein